MERTNEPRNSLHLKAMLRNIDQYGQNKTERSALRRIGFHAIRYINTRGINKRTISSEDACAIFELIGIIWSFIKKLTPNEVISIFPIQKDYKGYVHNTVDYHSTMKRLSEHGLDNVLGEAAEDILSEYHNRDILDFHLNELRVGSKLYRAEHGRSLLIDAIQNSSAQNDLILQT
jgi:hypothetical protein